MMTKGDSYRLTGDEQDIIIAMEQQIQLEIDLGLRKPFVDAKIDPSRGKHQHLDGFGAGFAFCKMMGQVYDTSVDPHCAYQSKPDVILADGRTGMIQHTIYPNGRLLVPIPYKGCRVTFFALMTGVMPKFIFRGWAAYEDLIKRETLWNPGKGPAYAMLQFDLNDEL